MAAIGIHTSSIRINHGFRVTALVTVVLLLTVACSLGALLTALRMERLMSAMVSANVPSVKAVAELENALQQQRGLVAAFMLDNGQPGWLNDLEHAKPSVAFWLAKARNTARTDEERRLLATLAEVYRTYDAEREKAITLYQSGRTAEARQFVLRDVSILSNQAYDLCRQLIALNERYVTTSMAEAHRRVQTLALALSAGVGVALLLSMMLLLVVYRRLLLPVQRLTADAKAFSDDPKQPRGPRTPFSDELRELEFYSRALMSDISRTRTDLQASEQRLMAAEKLAAVGKFAACAAHEIRNPLTSMKLWLYQLEQAGGSDSEVRHHCRVLEEEIGRLEDLATSFLQFSRPANPQLLPQDVSSIVRETLELAEPRLVQKNVSLVHVNGTPLPAVLGDAGQLRQVVLNLIVNAVDAVPRGGEVRVIESRESSDNGRAEVVVRVQDNGPGVPDSVRANLFEPFVTSKSHGTGLGLAVASSIVAQHGGQLVVESTESRGSVFAVRIPLHEG